VDKVEISGVPIISLAKITAYSSKNAPFLLSVLPVFMADAPREEENGRI
jgi:hypothetical protein